MGGVLKARLLQTSFTSYPLIMASQPITRSPFGFFPAELVLLIIREAAQPTFSQAEKYADHNPYSTTLSLCLVSKNFREIVLPYLLHTVSLPKSQNVRKFVEALHMQEAYAQESSPFQFEYASFVQKIWIGEDEDLAEPNLLRTLGYELASERERAMGLLAPVLLTAPSIALAWTSLGLLSDCLEIAWESRTDTDVNNEHSPPPWKTQTLTLSGKADSVRPWEFLMGTSHGSAFVASILHLASNNTSNNLPWGPLTDTPQTWAELADMGFLCDEGMDPRWLAHYLSYDQMYNLPQWMERTPWASFQKLQTVSLAYAHVRRPFNSSALITTGLPLHVEVLMLSASLLRHPVPWVASGFIKRGPGEECIVSDDVRFKVSRSCLHFRYAREDWQKVWACGFGRYDSKGD
ncbi:hypothetical protein DEU56DRAFT_856290 [Suillus clintonianus]|uniref:uncharacterized protein n=1 Tax=Suillus clintonianus TaxID=1904413 RepID=UPI001B86D4E4|nr:uncharacterized protein DEU56DRAFT_856290 [Suillus clintonianus]KAG2140119.1 hypothetical protein DEU56DRAFT_856290 [Suillus clintonianus]